MATSDAWAIHDEAGTEVAAVDQSGNAQFAGTVTADGATTTTGVATFTANVVNSSNVILGDQFVTAVVTSAGGSGGATAGTVSIQLNQADESTAIGSARQVLIEVCDTQYAPVGVDRNATVTFTTATTGTLVASGTAWALVETDASGVFACATGNSADETTYLRVATAEASSDPTDHCVVLASNSDDSIWAA